MEKVLVGHRFHPTGEELINYYLKNKILGKSRLVDDAISEINICIDEPYDLPSKSKLKSNDPVWYFFSQREFANAKKTAFKRTTPCGFWKSTGNDRIIKGKGGNKIGTKKTLVYYLGRVPDGVKTPWTTHEYQITCSSLNQSSYVIYKVMYKGEGSDISYGNNSTEQNQSLVSGSVNTAPEVEQPVQEADWMSLDDFSVPMTEQAHLSPSDGFNPDMFLSDKNNHSVQPYIPYEDESVSLWLNGGIFEDEIPNVESIFNTQNNDHKPKKALSGIISDDSDSEAESMFAMSYQGTSSPSDNIGSSNRYFPSCSSTDSNHESQLTRRIIPSKQKVRKGKSRVIDASMRKDSSSMVKVEKKSWLITEEAIVRNHENPPYIYLMNMIIGIIILLNLIGNIILNIKT